MSTVKWYGPAIRAKVEAANEAAIRKLAFDLEAGIKARITSNGQVDTGFMRNSVYTITGQDGVRGGASPGVYTDRSGRRVFRDSTTADPGDADAIVGVGAIYALWQELDDSFVRVTFEDLIDAVGGTWRGTFTQFGF